MLIRCGKYFAKKLIWEIQHHSLNMHTWDALKDNVKQAKILRTITEPCSNREFPRVQRKNYHAWKIRISLRSPMTWKVMPRNVWNDIVSFQTRQLNNSTKYQLLALMTINPNKKELKSVGELSQVCSQIVLKCLYLARIGRPDILWSVNKLARSITDGLKHVTNDYLV